MIRTTPFHERTGALNETGLWSHWAGYLAAEKYSLSEKFEYFAIRNAAGVFDTSPLYKYRFTGPDAEAFLAGVLARDPRRSSPGHAQYTIWCDDRGFARRGRRAPAARPDDFMLTAAEPNLAYFADLIGRRDDVRIEEVSEQWAVLVAPGPAVAQAAREPRRRDRPARLLRAHEGEDRRHAGHGLADRVHRRPRLRGVGEGRRRARRVGRRVGGRRGNGVLPFGLQALYMTRIEAGLLLLDVDFHNSRFAWTDADRATPHELGLGWMLRGIADDDRRFIGRDAIRRELADGTSRFRTTGLVVDWHDWDRVHDEAGLIPPKDHTPVQEEMFVYDDDGAQVGYATSFMYSPVLQRHIAIARVPVAAATPGHEGQPRDPGEPPLRPRAAETARMPLYNPARKTA